MIREAQISDIPKIVELGRRVVIESPRYARLNYSSEKVTAVLTSLINHADGLVLVDDELTSIAIAVVESEWCSDDRIAQEMVLYVSPHLRGSMRAWRLINRMAEWAKSRCALYMQGGASTGIDDERVIEMYERAGFVRCAIGVEKLFN